MKSLSESLTKFQADSEARFQELQTNLLTVQGQLTQAMAQNGNSAHDQALIQKIQEDANLKISALQQELMTTKAQLAQNASMTPVINDEQLVATQNELSQTKVQLDIIKGQLVEALNRPMPPPVVQYVDKYVDNPVPVVDPNVELMLQSLRRENTEKDVKIKQLCNELVMAKTSHASRIVNELDYSCPAVQIPLIPDESSYMKSNNPIKIVVAMGAKHGIGNTTIALNMATFLAKQGKKTLLMEFNNKFPMTNAFFELVNVPLGISDALASVSSNHSIADASIIRFHALASSNKGLIKIYKKLPPGLHLMTYANKDLAFYDKSYPTREGLFTLMQYLLNTQQYSHIILDIHSD